VQIAPCRPERTGLFPSSSRVVLTIVDFDAAIGPDRETLRALFGLTGAQASVAALLARGRDLRDIAMTLGISLYTVRRHLADVMAKTDTNSQVGLVYLLSRLSRADPSVGVATAHH
jgi:DNA-binding CsgD family transcriptional regulator